MVAKSSTQTGSRQTTKSTHPHNFVNMGTWQWSVLMSHQIRNSTYCNEALRFYLTPEWISWFPTLIQTGIIRPWVLSNLPETSHSVFSVLSVSLQNHSYYLSFLLCDISSFRLFTGIMILQSFFDSHQLCLEICQLKVAYDGKVKTGVHNSTPA